MSGPRARWLAADEVPPDHLAPCVWLLADDAPEWRALTDRLRPSRLDLADAALFTSPARSAARLKRRLLLRALAGRALGADPAAVVVERTSAGAIVVTAPQAVCASVSARDGWTAIALSATAIGVDLEAAAPSTPLAWAALHPREAAAMAALDPDAGARAFARCWVVKEAALKAAGVGLNRDPATLYTRFFGDEATAFEGAGRIFARAEVRDFGAVVAAVAVLAGEAAAGR